MGKINIEEVWKNQQTEKAELHDDEINSIRMRKSHGFLEKFQKSARIEHFMNVTVSVLMTIAFLVLQKWVSAVLIGSLFTILVLYYYNLYKELWQLKPTEDVHEFLQILSSKMKKFIQRYYAGLFILLPFSLFTGIWLAADGDVEWGRFTSTKGLLLLSSGIAATGILTYFMIELMYGRTYKKLKNLLAELDAEEDEMI
ncbi:MAG: hypothetical protein AAGC88_03410 [Bacteroidota bacterium]